MKSIIFSLCALLTVVSCAAPSGTKPVEIVSLAGPIPPFNPGGPTIEIVLKNVSTVSIVALEAEPAIAGAPGQHYVLDFNVSPASPLRPGQSISASMTLINGSLQTGGSYSVEIRGAFQGGKGFGYAVNAKVSPPPAR